ncbi:uncharacterized protein BDR25DRAFT_239503 [Lindgomyces ingoldianus]|uniref:Uncharacterized protein n=1 Tax=Lindgomyces ingoldianus TaxID=673940 RepID=A0ACB6QF54_9PLEO|nr:uncharacterized protein BDR25DRAFT_239503 [Lindgomyces ingoldianus]KAF2465613.1 hypothetical protein BDR25DRAFT_239503 [Lindgomyces ingoldianus]
MLWTTIYCVKFCFLAQFKFHKPPYAYVSKHLTRYYWSSIGICSAAVLVTLIQPIILCPNSDRCRYFRDASTVSLEMTVTALDIITDIFVISIPISLIYMANFTRLHTIINACFKCLSIFPIVVATARLALQYRAETRNINYIWVTFLLVVEAATAMIMASISSYRVVIIDYLAERRMRRGANLPSSKTYILGNGVSGREERIDIRLNDTAPQSSSVSELPMIHPAPTSPVGPTT